MLVLFHNIVTGFITYPGMPISSRYITTSISDGIAVVTINRPEKLNALNSDVLKELKYSFENLHCDDSVKGIIITGSGNKAFVAGADISEIAGLNPESAARFSTLGQDTNSLIASSSKPVLAAVNGFALGGGCELAVSCHLRIASGNAAFGFPEVKLGIIPCFGGTQRLAPVIGKGLAMEMILTGEIMDARRAEKIGLVNRLVQSGDLLLQEAGDWMKKIILNAPKALSMAIHCVQTADFTGGGLLDENTIFAGLVNTNDFREGTKAFMEKRKAEFKGN